MDPNNQYKTNVLWQDLQHKELIDLFNTLSDQNQKNSDPGTFTYTVGFLVMYANQHLKLEEGYMEEYNYPDKDYHKESHKEFIQKLKGFRKEYRSHSPDAVEKLLNNIKAWILTHIIENDKKLGAFILMKEKEKIQYS